MNFATRIFSGHHRHCDALFVAAEEAAQSDDWVAARAAYEKFNEQLQRHFDAEEVVLFPAFEAATGMSSGPTQVMRLEHRQMRSLLAQLEFACAEQNSDAYAGTAETLLMLMQQHNMKEENILYPLCDQALATEAQKLGARVNAILEHGDA